MPFTYSYRPLQAPLKILNVIVSEKQLEKCNTKGNHAAVVFI